ncbi:MAG: HEPN domain-containing protein [Gammaproteobacteria bacterium]|nr:HEPN domain-containing protein [Gammaproteobacteria bacterium]
MRPADDEVRTLLRVAAQDMAVLRLILDAPQIEIEGICFHAQQCVEKALKAMLAMHGVVYERTHNLVSLADTLADLGVVTPIDTEVLLRLNPCAVTFRYGDMKIPNITRQEAMTSAAQILDWANNEADSATAREG